MSLWSDMQKVFGLTCDEASKLLSDGMERTLTRPERIGLRLHLWICRACRRFRRQILLLRRLMHGLAQEDPPEDSAPGLTEDSRARLRDAIRKASGAEDA